MNEKIKEIYNRALYEYFGEEYKNCELDIYPEDQYFAELIIQECIQVCRSRVSNSDYNTGRMHCAWDIKKHFGVE